GPAGDEDHVYRLLPKLERDRRRAARAKKERTVGCVSYRQDTALPPALCEMLDVRVGREEFLHEPEHRRPLRIKILDSRGCSIGADHQLVAGEAKNDGDVPRVAPGTGETECDV